MNRWLNSMYEELKDLFTVTLAKRLTSPFLSTFIFASCVTNYDITLLIFSGTDWNTKVTYISAAANSIPFWTPWESYRVRWPLIVSAFYVLLWPLFDMLFYSISKGWNILYKIIQNLLEKVTPITPEQRQKIEDKLDITINGLRERLANKEVELTEQESKNRSLLKVISDKDREVEHLGKLDADHTKHINDLSKEVNQLKGIIEISQADADEESVSTEKPTVDKQGVLPETPTWRTEWRYARGYRW